MNPIPYLVRRLQEKSTWAAIAVAIPIASTLASPWSYASIGVAAVIALLPSPGKGSISPGDGL